MDRQIHGHNFEIETKKTGVASMATVAGTATAAFSSFTYQLKLTDISLKLIIARYQVIEGKRFLK
jgi:hypothetical protein